MIQYDMTYKLKPIFSYMKARQPLSLDIRRDN